MVKVKLYRRSATECLALADLVCNPGDRAMLVAMAARWHDLAQRADQGGSSETQRKPPLERHAPLRDVCASDVRRVRRDR